jgi:hypothetical protein
MKVCAGLRAFLRNREGRVGALMMTKLMLDCDCLLITNEVQGANSCKNSKKSYFE